MAAMYDGRKRSGYEPPEADFPNLRQRDHVVAKQTQQGRPACALVVALAFLSRAG